MCFIKCFWTKFWSLKLILSLKNFIAVLIYVSWRAYSTDFLFHYLDDAYNNDNRILCKYIFCQLLKITTSLIFITTLKDTLALFLRMSRLLVCQNSYSWQTALTESQVCLTPKSLSLQYHMDIFSVTLVVIWKAQQDPWLYILRDTSSVKMRQVIHSFLIIFA